MKMDDAAVVTVTDLIKFISTNEEAQKSVNAIKSIFGIYKDDFDNDKAWQLCHKAAIKICRSYNKNVAGCESYGQAVTPYEIDRLKLYLYDLSKESVKKC